MQEPCLQAARDAILAATGITARFSHFPIVGRCGACTDKCQFYLGTGDPQNFPVARAELLRKVYRRYFTPAGLFPSLGDAADLDEEMLKKYVENFSLLKKI